MTNDEPPPGNPPGTVWHHPAAKPDVMQLLKVQGPLLIDPRSPEHPEKKGTMRASYSKPRPVRFLAEIQMRFFTNRAKSAPPSE